ncbi:unnamed protein product [Paramecium pentaurelia]|uniref:Uncharacterized protein n=1 Tax=Paramecium pentaurelia TaxID=43138 RepID=A0A8S1WWC2_9CILI|nr:unnamed protein product [Paramecium pentaurelia]
MAQSLNPNNEKAYSDNNSFCLITIVNFFLFLSNLQKYQYATINHLTIKAAILLKYKKYAHAIQYFNNVIILNHRNNEDLEKQRFKRVRLLAFTLNIKKIKYKLLSNLSQQDAIKQKCKSYTLLVLKRKKEAQ